ncbi:MAG: Lrp/AsnC family transcriptional regulator [Acidobacteria bacterium]|nr:Lrp/AsnC family transcriptional regulator [Acidobacteriota bacterium]
MNFDSIDYKLLEILQQNARATQSELASAVGLSQPAVAERMKKLEQEGVITGYAAYVNARKLGNDIFAFIGVGIVHPKFNKAFAKKILSLPEVLECHHVTGKDSYLLKVKTENTEKLDELISVKLRTIPGVTRTQTTIVLHSVKEGTYIHPHGSLSENHQIRGGKPKRKA